MCNAVMLVWGSLRLAPPKIRHRTFAMLVKKKDSDSLTDLYSHINHLMQQSI